jgi:acetolactate synthase-1/2/3 large subunit
MAKPVTRWASRVTHTYRMAEYVNMAIRKALGPKPGPTYLDLPGDTLYGRLDEEKIVYPPGNRRPARPAPDPASVSDAIRLLKGAQRPLIVTGTGIHFSGASATLQEFVETTGVPFFTTPQGRGVIPEDHELSFLGARSQAFKECDVLFAVGTRFNFVIGQGRAPRWHPDMKVVHVDIDPSEIGHNRAADIGIVADAKLALEALTAEAKQQDVKTPADWHARLRESDADQRTKSLEVASSDNIPIHPMRVMKSVAESLDRDAILCVDGNETLSFSRQFIPSFAPGGRINAGPNGCMGTGLPFAVGAQVAAPSRQVLALVGDGSFLMNVQEIDTMVRHKLPVVMVVSNNGGWTGMPNTVAGRSLGFHQRYEQIAEALGGYGQFVEKPQEIKPAIERAFASGRPSVVHVHVEEHATATTASYGGYSSMQVR